MGLFVEYTPIGDLIVLSLCLVVFILIYSSYISRTKSFVIFFAILCAICGASLCNVFFHFVLFYKDQFSGGLIKTLRFLYHAFLYATLFFYGEYICEVVHLETERKRVISIVNIVLFISIMLADILGSVVGYGFVIDKSQNVKKGIDLFIIGYMLFMAFIFYLLINFGNRLYGKIMKGFYGTILVAVIIIIVQKVFKQSSFTVSTFLLPTIAIFYLIHSNPYDLDVGAVNVSGFEDLISYSYKKKSELLILSLYMKDFDAEGKRFPDVIQKAIRKISSEFFKNAVMFQISNGHVILCVEISKNPDHENKVNGILNAFDIEYAKFQYDYKIVIGHSIDEISSRNEYVGFINHIHNYMSMNTVHFIEYEDVLSFDKQKYILEELYDIYRRRDLNDERVEVYCQPVYNIQTGQYDTAEALMRLKLSQIGMVFPDQFIPLAEQSETIHILSLIILNKTCNFIRKMLIAGYYVNRISINISVMEMRDDHFCDDVNTVIKNSGIPEGKIAIEVTESQNESDFLVMRDKISELKERGIKFYLDDFGTGYSNFERIMELPFDIVKFDRSLVIASSENEKSERMVGNLAQMFSNMDYSVLFEGVENERDEKKCIKMAANYLQGYKYSRPIPIEQLKEFFDKKSD